MKIAFVIQRCSKEIHGGAESLTYNVGLKLSELIDVEIITTRSRDAATWKNFYPEGIEKIQNLTIRRFSVTNERDPSFVPISQYLENNNDDLIKGEEFVTASGPVSYDLLNFIKNHKNEYDLFVFVGFLYWQTYNVIPLVKEKSILLPTAHDEPWIHFKVFEKVFDLPYGYLFLTESEQKFVHKKFHHLTKPFSIVGHGVNLELSEKNHNVKKLSIPENFILYIGRISAAKGCKLLVDYFDRYVSKFHTNLKLVMIGTKEQEISSKNTIIFENLDDETKFHIMQKCNLFVMPSFYESLNIACLEAWLFDKPVLVNGKSEVLKEHCIKSNGGLYFENYEQFVECIQSIINDSTLSKILGNNGKQYVTKNYNWNITTEKYVDFFNNMLSKIST